MLTLLRLSSSRSWPAARSAFAYTRTFTHSSPNNAASQPDLIHQIYVSNSTNPYFNLALEDWLFRNAPRTEPLLLIYRDEPCIVIGRNQNPWKEINMRVQAERGVPIIRRMSGGGTVYHDEGNTNFSIHLPPATFDRQKTGELVLEAVRALRGEAAHMNERHDICVHNEKISYFVCPIPSKVSGSAYKITNKRSYHHGTMLITSELHTLGSLLRTNKETMITKGVASVRSPVTNISKGFAHVTHQSFVEALINVFKDKYGVQDTPLEINQDDSTISIEHITNTIAQLKTWEWTFGQTPEFTQSLEKTFPWGAIAVQIRSKNGIILSCVFTERGGGVPTRPDELVNLSSEIEGKRYGLLGECRLEGAGQRTSDIWQWLADEMAN